MPRAEAPLIDGRTYSDLVAEVEELIRTYTAGGWQPVPGQPDAGSALVRIFSRMAELVVTRVNRLPDRNFLSFLDLIGTRLNPPQPARAPLTFLLAAGSPVDALVPAGTQAAAVQLEGGAEPPLFETERDLVVTRSQLVAVYTRDLGRRLWADHTAVATGRSAGTFQPFRGDPGRPLVHRLYVSHALLGLPEAKVIELLFSPAEASLPWPSAVAWSIWNGTAWENRTPTIVFKPGTPQATWSVRLTDVPGLAASPVNGVDGFWLRGELTLPLGPGDNLPRIESPSVRVTIDRTGVSQRVLPDRGFANQTPLDLDEDIFFPFGSTPKLGDTFYLASDAAFSKPGLPVDLHIDVTSTASAPPLGILDLRFTWEFWSGREWKLLGRSSGTNTSSYQFSDTTEGFRKDGIVHFTVPSELAATAVNGEVRRWVRMRISTPGFREAISLRSIHLSYKYDPGSQPPQRVLTENDLIFADVPVPAVGPGGFTPFVPSADLKPTLYLGFDRPGDTIGFANRSTALFFQASEALYDEDPEAGQAEGAGESTVTWEYWNGTGWERLGTRDETHGLTRSGMVTFIGPPDLGASEDFGRTAFWLRGRWERSEHAVEPRLVRILTNTMWAANARTIRGEVLGSGRSERGQVFRTLRTPVLAGPVLEVIEPEIPPGADLAELEAEEGDGAVAVVRDSEGRPVEVRVRWHEVPDFHGSGPRSRHYVLDHRSGEVRFGDGRRGLVPPPGRNNVRMARYRTGGGLASNRPAGSIARLQGTVPYVAGVVQLMPAEGGADEESLEAVRTRGPKALRHRDRAAAAADFEDLAFQASPQVARARALPARRSSEGGRVGLIIVPADGTARPRPSLELLARVRSYIEERLSPVVDLWIVGPDWLQVDVRAEVVPQQLEAAADVQTGVRERLRAFLHPLSGGPHGEGWELGRKPHRSDLYALIEDTPGVDHVRRLEVVETPQEGGARSGRFLVFSGNHEIDLSGNVDDADDAAGPGNLP